MTNETTVAPWIRLTCVGFNVKKRARFLIPRNLFKLILTYCACAQERLQQSRFEDKYKVDIIPDPVTGERKMVDREEGRKGARKKKKLLDEDGQEMPKKINRKKLAKLKRKQKLAEKQVSVLHVYNIVCGRNAL